MWTSPNRCSREAKVTTPMERTKAVKDTRELLELLAASCEVTVPGLIQTVATRLLRHYPLDVDLDVSALALPSLWASLNPPSAKLSGHDDT
ncbi:BPSL0761 family protein [Paraburkholderia sp. JPY465]|uniref:BPSL0761 family protein n=1 Tax=Paraburkholderia sp. JPY465 TaxID=3042285 RepID=UPI003D1C0BC0